jgi:predicted phosphodiesterase
MRIAIVSDIHGNRTAFDAVLADLHETSPDIVLHGGDLADSGSGGAEIVDQIRDLGWPGVAGNTDELLTTPDPFEEFARQAPHLGALWSTLREMAAANRAALGEERLAWLRGLPRVHVQESVALVHAVPGTTWRSPQADASDGDLASAYRGLDRSLVVYGHIHKPFVRHLGHVTVINSGSVGMPYDGDPRAAYAVIDGGGATIRRVGYPVEREVKRLLAAGLLHATWVARMLETSAPQMP